MFTNELKKGTIVILRNGWRAILEDNKKGNIRDATVEGFYSERGSIVRGVQSMGITSFQQSLTGTP